MTHILRSYRGEDAPWVAAFLREVHRRDPRFDGPEDDAFAAFVAQPGNRNGADFVVAGDREGIAGVLLSGRTAAEAGASAVRSFKVIVHPRAQGRALESELISRAEAQDGSETVVLRTVIDAELSGLDAVLRCRGYRHRQTILHMRRSGLPPAMDTLAPGLSLRDADPAQDGEVITQLYNLAHRHAFGFAPISRSDLEATLGAPGGRLMVLVDQDGVIGTVQTLPFYGGVGVLQALEISPEWQGKGLGKYLAKVAISALAQHGFRTVDLAVDAENTPAVGLYTRLGFTNRRRDLTFESGGVSQACSPPI